MQKKMAFATKTNQMQLFCKMRFFLDISYLGTSFHGWQIQPNGITIQSTIEQALQQIVREKVAVTGSGRTDTGVHARHQIAHIDLAEQIDIIKFQYQLNQVLPHDIVINKITEVKSDAHARFDAISRLYHYYIHTTKNPFIQHMSWHLAHPLDLDKITRACSILINQTDFQSFSLVKTEVSNFKCELMDVRWELNDHGYVFKIKSNRFLRGMVRAIVGTLVDVGKNKTSVEQFEEIIKGKHRSKAGTAAPARGLFLEEVQYPASIYNS